MNAWISFFTRYILVGIIGISAIIFLVPTDKEDQQSLAKFIRDKLNIEQFNDDNSELVTPTEQSNSPTSPSHTKKTTTTQNNTRWGIVSSSKATYYTSKGKFIGHLSPGTALNIIKITQTTKGPLAVCRPFKQPSSDIILIKPELLTFHNSDINNLSKKLEQLYVQQAQLTAEIATLKKQKAKALRRDNPYARKYAISKQEYHDYWRKVKELTRKRDAASNNQQMDYADELRLMKGHDIRIANNLKQVKSDYDNWNLAHPRPASNNNEVNKLLTELARIEKIISSMENG